MVSPHELKLIDRSTNDVVQNCNIDDVTYSGLDPKDKKGFVYITRTKLGLWYCHVFAVKEKAAEIPKAINKAFQAASSGAVRSPISRQHSVADALQKVNERPELHRQMSAPVTMGATSVPASTSTGPNRKTFDAYFLGSVPVNEQMGNQVIKDAVAKNAEHRKQLQVFNVDSALVLTLVSQSIRKSVKGKKQSSQEGDPVTLIVSSESVRTVERLTGETVMAEFIRNISFTGVPEIEGKKKEDIFAYIANNERLVSTCLAEVF